jgi:hypothetical protein
VGDQSHFVVNKHKTGLILNHHIARNKVYNAEMKNNEPPKLARNKIKTTSLQIRLGISSHKPQHTNLQSSCLQVLNFFKSLQIYSNSNPFSLIELWRSATDALQTQMSCVIAFWKAYTNLYCSSKIQLKLTLCPFFMVTQSFGLKV